MITGSDGTFDLAQTCPATGGAPGPSLPKTGPGLASRAGALAAGGAVALMVGVALVCRYRRRPHEDMMAAGPHRI